MANVNSWNASNPEALCYYYFPGDVIRLKVYSPIPNYLQMKVEVIKTTTIEKYVKIREGYHLKDNKPCDFKSPLFHSAGQGVKATEFKRVNSIDQFGNEGFTAKLTKAKMTTATWFNCYLYKEKDGKLFKYPFTSDFQIDMRCPDESAIEVEEFNPALGGEKVTIHPETFIGFDKIK